MNYATHHPEDSGKDTHTHTYNDKYTHTAYTPKNMGLTNLGKVCYRRKFGSCYNFKIQLKMAVNSRTWMCIAVSLFICELPSLYVETVSKITCNYSHVNSASLHTCLLSHFSMHKVYTQYQLIPFPPSRFPLMSGMPWRIAKDVRIIKRL